MITTVKRFYVEVLAYFAAASLTNIKKRFVTTTPGRSDDNEESLKKRFDTYMNATMQIINIFEEQVPINSDSVFATLHSLHILRMGPISKRVR